MNTIKVGKKNQAFLQIDCDQGIANEISDFFTFYAEGYKFSPAYKNKMWDGQIRLFNRRNGELPIGLFKYLQEFLEVRDYTLELVYNNYYGIPSQAAEVDMSYIEECTLTSRGEPIAPRDYQLDAVFHGIKNKGALLISPTASGKSLIIYLLIRFYLNNYNNDILLVVPTTSLVKQMYSDFKDYSEFDDGFDGDDLCHMIYSGKDKYINKKIIITTWQSVYKQPTKWFERFGMIVGDEAHNFKAKSLTTILGRCKEAEYRFGTTGTLDGSKVHMLVLEGGFGPSYHVTSTKKLMDSGDLAELNINMLLLKYPDELCQIVSKLKYQDEVDFIVQHEKRNSFISKVAIDREGNTLVLYQFVAKHGKPLFDLIQAAAHRKRKVFFVSGSTDVDTREEIRKITETENDAIIVASFGTFSTGINIRNIHNIIFASPSKSQIKILQSIGRGLRKSDNGAITQLYDIADDFHWKKKKNYTLDHAAERIKIYSREKFNYRIYEINL